MIRSVALVVCWSLLATRNDAFLLTNPSSVPRTIQPHPTQLEALPKSLAQGFAAASMAFLLALPAAADTSRVVGSIPGSGILFKDTLQIEEFEDPKVQGVHLYVSNFQIPVAERVSKGNFFADPAYTSVACARGKTVRIADTIDKSIAGEEVFEESKSLLFKTLRVRRVYDEATQTVVYVSYNTRFDKGSDDNKSRFKSSLCAVNLE